MEYALSVGATVNQQREKNGRVVVEAQQHQHQQQTLNSIILQEKQFSVW